MQGRVMRLVGRPVPRRVFSTSPRESIGMDSMVYPGSRVYELDSRNLSRFLAQLPRTTERIQMMSTNTAVSAVFLVTRDSVNLGLHDLVLTDDIKKHIKNLNKSLGESAVPVILCVYGAVDPLVLSIFGNCAYRLGSIESTMSLSIAKFIHRGAGHFLPTFLKDAAGHQGLMEYAGISSHPFSAMDMLRMGLLTNITDGEADKLLPRMIAETCPKNDRTKIQQQAPVNVDDLGRIIETFDLRSDNPSLLNDRVWSEALVVPPETFEDSVFGRDFLNETPFPVNESLAEGVRKSFGQNSVEGTMKKLQKVEALWAKDALSNMTKLPVDRMKDWFNIVQKSV